MKALVKQHPLMAFTLLAYAFSWACWLPILNNIQTELFASGVNTVGLLLLGGYGPSIAAVIMSAITGGKAEVKALFKRMIMGRTGVKWWAVVLLTGPAIFATATIGYLLAGGELGPLNKGLIPWIPVIFIASLPFGPLGEELGWRGFALRQLDSKRQFIQSSLIIGVIWTFWHAPLFWAASGTAVSGLPVTLTSVGLFLAGVTGTSFIYTWVHNHTNGSVLMAILLHLGWNAAGSINGMFFPEMSQVARETGYTITVAVTWTLVFFIVLAHKAYTRKSAVLTHSLAS